MASPKEQRGVDAKKQEKNIREKTHCKKEGDDSQAKFHQVILTQAIFVTS